MLWTWSEPILDDAQKAELEKLIRFLRLTRDKNIYLDPERADEYRLQCDILEAGLLKDVIRREWYSFMGSRVVIAIVCFVIGAAMGPAGAIPYCIGFSMVLTVLYNFVKFVSAIKSTSIQHQLRESMRAADPKHSPAGRIRVEVVDDAESIHAVNPQPYKADVTENDSMSGLVVFFIMALIVIIVILVCLSGAVTPRNQQFPSQPSHLKPNPDGSVG